MADRNIDLASRAIDDLDLSKVNGGYGEIPGFKNLNGDGLSNSKKFCSKCGRETPIEEFSGGRQRCHICKSYY